MKLAGDLSRVAALIGDPARAAILSALMSGKALTASELAREASITPQTASAHLAKLEAGGLIAPRKQGRHKYVTLASAEVAAMIETMGGIAAQTAPVRTGPRDAAMRDCRVCYNHLAGHRAVALFDAMVDRGHLDRGAGLTLTASGHAFVANLGVDCSTHTGRGPLVAECLDWSERRSHLGGWLSRAMLTRFEVMGWLRRSAKTRHVTFTPEGLRQFDLAFRVEDWAG